MAKIIYKPYNPHLNEHQKLMDAAAAYYGEGSDAWYEIASSGIKTDDFYNAVKQIPGVDITMSKDGKVLGYHVNDFFQPSIKTAEPVTPSAPAIGGNENSNATASVKESAASIKIPSVAKPSTTTTGKFEFSSGIGYKADTGVTVPGVISTVSTATMAVSVGALLGKAVDSALYNANPDFWDSHNMSTLNPDTWNSIVSDAPDGISKDVVTTFLHLNPDDGSATAYIDADTLGYLTWYLANSNFFDESQHSYLPATAPVPDNLPQAERTKKNMPIYYGGSTCAFIFKNGSTETVTFGGDLADTRIAWYCAYETDRRYPDARYGMVFSKTAKTITVTHVSNSGTPVTNTLHGDTTSINGQRCYVYVYAGATVYPGYDSSHQIVATTAPYNDISRDDPSYNPRDIALSLSWLSMYGDVISTTGITGVNNISGTKTISDVDAKNINSVDTALAAILGILPALASAALVNNIPQPDGSTKQRTYYPVPFPIENPADLGHPVSYPDYFNQNDPSVDPDHKTLPDSLYEFINKLLGKDAPDDDIPDIGSGDVPSIIYPAGAASSLWAIYNPTLGQLDAFGAWLWSSDFIDQIKKLFADPMQAIIGLHKVYATPNIGGAKNIKVGYLDSGVSANTVSDQYVTIDCGSLNIREFFGNVLDYAPNTRIELYLPFIGIVDLNPADVMRSTISVKYGIDVLSGACLANVDVQRDNAGGVLYTYAGNAAVTYPLSSGSYMGMVANVVSIASSAIRGGMMGGAAGAVAGGVIGTVESMLGGRNGFSVSHSGAFSGNAGAMGNKTPYIIIGRPQSIMNNGFPALQGYPSNVFTALSSCKGYTKVKAVHVDAVPSATQEEKEMIESALKSGVIIG